MEHESGQATEPAHAELTGTIDKALELLFRLHDDASARGVSDLGRRLGLPKSTTHRLLGALAKRGLVERDALGRYRPGIALVALGLGVLEREPLVAAARPVLEHAAEALGETIFLAAARAGRLYVLDKQEGTGYLRAAPRAGDLIPAHATAIGKLYLALAPEDLRPPAAGLERFTPATLADAAQLERELERVRAAGYAEMHDEWIRGLSGIAAPIRLGGRLFGAIAVAGPSAHFDGAREASLRRGILAAASEVEARISGARTGRRASAPPTGGAT